MAKRKHSSMRTRSLGDQEYDAYRTGGGMVSENRSKHANLPTEVIMKEYPMVAHAEYPFLNDTIEGIDNRMRKDKAGMNKGKGMDIKY